MTDYLEEHLSGAEILLERLRKLEQSALGLPRRTALEENVDSLDDFSADLQHTRVKSNIVSNNIIDVYDTNEVVNQLNNMVAVSGAGPEIRGKEPNVIVNYYIKEDDNTRNLGQIETVPRAEGTQIGSKRADSRLSLSAQLENLDRAVSALTTPAPGGREAARVSYPVSLSGPQGLLAGSKTTGGPGETWSGPGTASGADLAYGGERSWAEQTDRIFRRDSRRYDGGFTLY